MSALITNGQTFPGTSINVSTNLINIGLGEKLLVDAGIVNSIIFGAWNRLVAGSSTVINLGTKMNATLANSLSVSFGGAWHYVDSNQTIHEEELRWAINHIEVCAGVDQTAFTSNHNKQIGVVLAIVSMFAFTLGMSILATLLPPFKIGNNGKNDSSSAKGLSSNGIYILIGESFAILSVILAQFILARKMAEDNRNAPYLSRLSLAAKGMTMCLYNNTYSLPRLISAADPSNIHKIDYYQFNQPITNSQVNLGYAMFGMLPGILDIARPNYNSNWRNLKQGVYLHNETPILTLNKHSLTDQVEYNTLIDLQPSSMLLATDNKEFRSSIEINHNMTVIQCFEVETNKGGAIIIDDANTRIIRNSGSTIQVLRSSTLDNNYKNISGLILAHKSASFFSSANKTGVFIAGETGDCSIDVLAKGKTLASFTDRCIDLCGTKITPLSFEFTKNLTIKLNTFSTDMHFCAARSPKYNSLLKEVIEKNTNSLQSAAQHVAAMHGVVGDEIFSENMPESMKNTILVDHPDPASERLGRSLLPLEPGDVFVGGY